MAATTSTIRLTFPNALLVVSVGILLVVLGYVRGREDTGYGLWLYWSGYILIFGTVVVGVISRRTSTAARVGLVVVYGAVQSYLRWAYSPFGFSFSDELQHLRALENVLSSNHLFSHNYSLPVSSSYPGLENVAAELVRVAGLGPYPAGVLIAAVAHVFSAVCVMLLFREISRSDRVACIAAVIYLLNPHASYFNTSFLYETLALPFAILALLFTVRFVSRGRGGWVNFYALLACMAMVTMTHHVTALATVGLIWVVAVGALCWRRARPMVLPLSLCAVAATLVVLVWIFSIAPITIEYLSDPVQQLYTSALTLLSFSTKISLPGAPTPVFDRVVAPLGMLLSLILLVTSVRRMGTRRTLEVLWIWLAVLIYGGTGAVRIVVSNGPELSGRLLTFASLFSALGVAIALAQMTSVPVRREHARFSAANRTVGAVVISMVLFVASVITSLPAWFQRVPNGFWIEAAAGSGFDNVGLSRAQWAKEYLHPGARFAGDTTAIVLLSTLAPLDPVKDPAALYYSDRLTPEDVEHIKSSGIIYVDVDTRLAQYTPLGGKYFPNDIHSGTRSKPIDFANIVKFDSVAGVSRIYDSGYARFYDMRGGREAPYAR